MHENARRDARNTTLNRGGTMRAGLATEVAGHRAGHGNKDIQRAALENPTALWNNRGGRMGALQWLLIAAALVVFSAGWVGGASWTGAHRERRRLEDD